MPEAKKIQAMFNTVSTNYDLLNDVLSLGVHRIWKAALVRGILKHSPSSVLDCATGTGDIALQIKKATPRAAVTGLDFSEGMLNVAKTRSEEISWIHGDVTKLSFEDNSFDVSCISYGIRNVEDTKKALNELARVSSKAVYVLEFGTPQNKLFRSLYFGAMKNVMPSIGRVFGKKEAYEYLIESSQAFPSDHEFLDIAKQSADFKSVSFRPMFGGVTYLYELIPGKA